MAVERLKACDNIVELSQELGVHRRLLYKWRDQFDPFDPDEVPPATDITPLDTNIRDTEQWEEERAEVKREEDHDELLIHPDRRQFPPTHYDE